MFMPVNSNEQPTMSSREIADLTGKSHTHVIRDIEKMLAELDLAQSTFGSGYFDANNQQRKCYNLPRFECEVLVTGYDIKRRVAIIKRWMEFEQRHSEQPKPMTQRQVMIQMLQDQRLRRNV